MTVMIIKNKSNNKIGNTKIPQMLKNLSVSLKINPNVMNFAVFMFYMLSFSIVSPAVLAILFADKLKKK
jgi:ammonia channel protein AmtB